MAKRNGCPFVAQSIVVYLALGGLSGLAGGLSGLPSFRLPKRSLACAFIFGCFLAARK